MNDKELRDRFSKLMSEGSKIKVKSNLLRMKQAAELFEYPTTKLTYQYYKDGEKITRENAVELGTKGIPTERDIINEEIIMKRGLPAYEYWVRATYPEAYKKNGDLRKDHRKLMKLKENKGSNKSRRNKDKTKKKDKPEVIEVEEDEFIDGE